MLWYTLDTQSHDGVDNVIVVLLQRLDGFLAADVGLGHYQLNVLVLQTLDINLLFILIVLILIGFRVLSSLGGQGVAVAGVIAVRAGLGELLGSSLLGGGVHVLNLGFAKNTTGRVGIVREKVQ